jgi:hypothetical protein
MPDPLLTDVQSLTKEAGGPGVSSDVAGDLTWAALNLSAARAGLRIVEELGMGHTGFERLHDLLHEEWDQLEVAAMSLGFGDVKTAMDLCVNAAMRLGGAAVPANGAFYAVESIAAAGSAVQSLVATQWMTHLRECAITTQEDVSDAERSVVLPWIDRLVECAGKTEGASVGMRRPQIKQWLDELSNAPDLGLLIECRDALTHRRVARQMSLGRTRKVCAISLQDGRQVGIDELIPQLVAFGEATLRGLCEAIRTDATDRC